MLELRLFLLNQQDDVCRDVLGGITAEYYDILGTYPNPARTRLLMKQREKGAILAHKSKRFSLDRHELVLEVEFHYRKQDTVYCLPACESTPMHQGTDF